MRFRVGMLVGGEDRHKYSLLQCRLRRCIHCGRFTSYAGAPGSGETAAHLYRKHFQGSFRVRYLAGAFFSPGNTLNGSRLDKKGSVHPSKGLQGRNKFLL